MNNGAALLASAKVRAAADGQLLTVQRGETSQGAGDATTRAVTFIPQPVAFGWQTYSVEGAAPIGDPNYHDFVTPGDSDVQKNDLILGYDGNDWRVGNIVGSPIGGVRPWLHCVAAREGVS